MTLEQLKILVAIVEQGSMHAAAEFLYRTQPTLSVSIKKLEEELKVKIFSRENRRMTLTPVGQALYQKSKRILAETQALKDLGKQYAIGNEPLINIAIGVSIPIGLISGVLKSCGQAFPETRLDLLAESGSDGPLDRLKKKEADLAVVTYFEEHPNFESIPLLFFKFFPVAASSHPLAQYDTEIPYEDLKDYVQVILAELENNAKENYWFVDEGRHWRVNDYHTRKDIILEGLGWGTLPDFNIKYELKDNKIKPLKIKNYFHSGKSQICVIRRANELHGPVAQHLWESFLATSLNEGPG